MSLFEDFVNLELPRRPVMLTSERCGGYTGDPNDISAPDLVKNAPKGTFYLRQSDLTLWKKDSASPATWTAVGGGGGVAIYATEALLLADTPADGTIGYAQDVDRYYARANNLWTPFAPVLMANVILAVSTTGNDSDPARPTILIGGDWSANPFATIQAAVNAIPKIGYGVYTATINVEAGTYAGVFIDGYATRITINGAQQLATLATGPNAGTATSGSSTTLVLTGAGWTVNNLRGKFLAVTSGAGAGQNIPINSNTVDTITVGRASPAFAAGSVFEIRSTSVIINTTPVGATARFYVSYCTEPISVYDIEALVGTSGFMCTHTSNFLAQRCVAHNGSASAAGFRSTTSLTAQFISCMTTHVSGSYLYGFIASNTQNVTLTSNLAIGSASGSAFVLQYVSLASMTNGNYATAVSTGIFAQGCSNVSITYSILELCSVGLSLNSSKVEIGTTCEIKNSVSTTMMLVTANLLISSALGGTGNSGFGVTVAGSGNYGSHVKIGTATPTITGASGDLTVDGINAITWTAFTAGSYASNETTGARITR